MRPRTHTIRESIEELNELRHFYDGTIEELKLSFLRFLKEHPDKPLSEASEYVGITTRRGRYWWTTYRKEGLRGLLDRRAWGRDELERKVVLPRQLSAEAGQTYSSASSTSLVDYPALMNAIAGIANIDHPLQWARAFGDALMANLIEVDYAVVSVKVSVDPQSASQGGRRFVYRHHEDKSGKLNQDVPSIEKIANHNYEILIAQGQNQGFPFQNYHFPPTGFDFFVNQGTRERTQNSISTCTGSLLLFRSKSLPSFSAETIDLIERIRPFMAYVMTDYILRVHREEPEMEFYRQSLERIAGEASLTDREHSVLGLILLGYTEKKIADVLKISIKTVESHMRSIYRKTGVTKMNELFARYQTPLGFNRKNEDNEGNSGQL